MPTMSKFSEKFRLNADLLANKTYVIKPSGAVQINQFVPLSKLMRLYKDLVEIHYSYDLPTDEIFISTFVRK